MATVEPEQFFFSPESLGFRDEVRNRLSQRMRELALELVRSEHRQRVLEEDVKAVIPQAIRDVMAEFGISLTNS